MKETDRIVELFLICAKNNLIVEVDRNDLRNYFFKATKMEQFQPLLTFYHWNENELCLKLELEINDLIVNKKITEYENYLYIYNMPSNYLNEFDKEIISLIDQMVLNFVKFNMKNQEKKPKIKGFFVK